MNTVSRIGLLLAVAVSTACRDGVAPNVTEARTPLEGQLVQLTYNPGNDLNPAWSKDADTVYYAAAGFIDYPRQPSTILRIARSGGIASMIAPDAQVAAATLVLPVMSPQRDRVAYVQLGFMNPPALCADPLPPAAPLCSLNEPLLQTGVLRVRAAGATAGAGADPGVDIPFQGTDPRRPAESAAAGVASPYLQRAFPYQTAYRARSELLFRPTWSPDGRQIAFSDGLTLRLWNTTASASTPIPGTSDGVSPAWSPGGDLIAFARLVRGDSVRVTCFCTEPGSTQAIPDVHTRWTYTVTRTVITLIKPDGTGAVELTSGQEPAWSPDGNSIYFTNFNQIYRIARAGGTPVAVKETEGGRSPSVSPDGKWLAFTRGTATNQNIWVLNLSGQ